MRNRASTSQENVALPTLAESAGYAARILKLVGKNSPRALFALLVLSVCLAVLPVIAAYIAHLLIDSVKAALDAMEETVRANAQRQALIFACAEGAALAGVMAARWLSKFVKRVLQAQAAYVVNQEIFAKTATFDLSTLEDAETQQRVILARQNANTRPYSLINRVFDGGMNSITALSVAVLLFGFSPWAVLIVIVGGIPLLVSEIYHSGQAYRFITGKTPENRRRNYLANLLTSEGAGAERIFYQADPELNRTYDSIYRKTWDELLSILKQRTGKGLFLMLLGASVFLGVGIWVVWSATVGALTIGAMVMYLALLRQGQTALQSILATFAGGYEDLLYISNFYTLIDMPQNDERGSGTCGKIPGDGYRFENVSFEYPNMTTPSLDDVSFHLPAGTRLGLLGANGSGKTTLVKLITGLYLPTRGRITLDGTDLCDWDPKALFARASILFQPFMRYRFTVADTIAMGEGLRVRDEERLLKAAELGRAKSVVDALPDGLRTKLSREFHDGRELSGGQWQRLALARAMLREDANLLVLDEPTSALDPAAEAEFLESLREFPGSMILITHRLMTMLEMDHIIVLDGGRISESGSHSALMENGGEYSELFIRQAEAYMYVESPDRNVNQPASATSED